MQRALPIAREPAVRPLTAALAAGPTARWRVGLLLFWGDPRAALSMLTMRAWAQSISGGRNSGVAAAGSGPPEHWSAMAALAGTLAAAWVIAGAGAAWGLAVYVRGRVQAALR